MKRFFCIALVLTCYMLLTGCATTTPLMEAAQKGDVNAVKDLLGKGAPVDELGPYNTTALREAIDKGQFEIAKYLVEKGANVNAPDTFGETPLFSAVINSHLEIERFLIDKGANVSARNYQGWTPLAYAKKGETASLLIAKGADVNAVNNHGASPLSSAAMKSRTEVVKVLIEKGADLDAALAQCQGTLEEWSKSSNKYIREMVNQPKQCIAILSKIKNEREEAKRREQEIEKARIIEAQKAKEMKEIVKEVLSASSPVTRTGDSAKTVASDVDRPTYKMPESASKFAIVVGIEKYSEIPEVSFAERDAAVMKDHLVAMGFPQRNIILLTGQKATRSGLVKNIETWLSNNVNHNSTVFFYYSGHGAPDPVTGEAYLVPFDGDPNYLGETGYALSRLYQKLGELKARRVMIVLDSCFSGSGGRSVLAKGARPLVLAPESQPLPSKLIVLSATQGAQISTSSPGRGHGLLTYYYLKALNEGNTEIDDIYSFLKPRVEDEARSLNVSQSPSLQRGH